MGGCLYLDGVLLASFAQLDLCGWATATILFGPPAAALAWMQHLATFRGHAPSARILSVGFGILAGVCAMTAFAMVGELLLATTISSYRPVTVILLLFAAPAIWFAVTSWLNAKWHRRLLSSKTDRNSGDPRGLAAKHFSLRVSIRELLGLLTGVSVLLAGFATTHRDVPPQHAMHVTPKIACLSLPNGASDVCVYRASRGTIWYDFAIDEQGFWDWSRGRVGSLESYVAGVPAAPIDQPFTISRCSESGFPDAAHSIKRGWYYDWSAGDRGIHYAFDADAGRVFYHAHFH